MSILLDLQGATTVLAAASGSFALTGNAATFQVGLAANASTYALAGNAAALTPTIVASAGSYILTGNVVGLIDSGVFPDIGSSISGGQFSRGRWRDMREAVAAELRAKREAAEREKRREREAALKAAAEYKAATEAARALEDQANAQRAIERMLANAQQSALDAQRMHAAMRPSPAMLMAAQQAHAQMQAAKDDDEAMQLFMASEG